MKSFGEQLRDARKERPWTQLQLSRNAEVGYRTVVRIEADTHDTTMGTLVKLVREFPYQKFTFMTGGYEVTVMAHRKDESLFTGRKK
jgi:transcriptional regulator with XRE-family HTH domain